MSTGDNREALSGIVLTAILILSVFTGIPVGATSSSMAGTISATDYSLVETQGYTNEPLNASVTVNNTKSTEDTKQVVVEQYLEYSNSWETVGSKNVTVSAGSERTVNVTYFIDSVPSDGKATVRVNSLSNSTVGIQDSPTYVRDVSTSASTVSSGNAVTTDVTVRNHGTKTVERRVTLQWGASDSSSQVVKLNPDSQKTIQFNPTLDIAGYQSLKAAYTTSEPVQVTNTSVDVSVSDRALQTPTIYTRENLITNATVTNNDANATQYAVTLDANHSSSTLESHKTRIISLSSGQSKNVSVETYLSRPGEYGVTLNGQQLPTATVKRPYNATNLTVQDNSVIAGEQTNITVDVENRKSSQIDRDITLEANKTGYWDRLSTQNFVLNASEQKELTFSVTFNTAGQYPIRAANSGQQQIDVQSVVNVTNVSLPEPPVYVEEPVFVNATVTNRLDTSTNETVLLEEQTQWGYRNLSSTDVQLAAGESKRISLPYTFDREGSTTIRIGGDETRTIDVKETPVSVLGVAVSDREIDSGNETTITATLQNWGSNGTEFNATLNIDGRSHELNSRQLHKTVYVGADQKETVTFTPTFTMGGSHSIAVRYEEAGIVSVNDSDVSVVSGSVAPDVVYKRDNTPVSVTLENTAGTTQKFAVTTSADKNTSEYYTSTNTTVVSIGANSQKTTDVAVRPYSVGNYTITANGEVVDSLQVKRGIKVDSVSFSARVVNVGETLYFNQTLRNPTSNDRTYYAHINGQSHRTDVAAETTKDVSRALSFQSPGVKRVWADGRSYQLFAVGDTTGTANASFQRVYTPRKVVNGSTEGVFARVTNTGDATTVRNVTLSINGTAVASERVYLPANRTSNVYLEHTFESKGDFTGELNISGGPTKQFNGTVRSEVVVDGSASISHVSGTQPSSMPVVDAEYQSGSIYLKVTQNGRYVRDLSALGADSTTRFNISFLVKNYEPRVVVGSGRDIDLNITDTAQQGQKRVSLQVKPSQLDYKYDFQGGYPSSPEEWENKVQNNTADYGWDTAVHLRVGNAKSAFTSADASTLSGMTVSTDAQLFTMPRYIPNTSDTTPHLEVSLAAPHKTVDGNVNDGYYVAFLPDALLSEWNVTDPESQLDASFQNQNLTMDITETADGAIVNISLHYSSGTLQISKSTSSSNDSGSDSSDSGDSTSDSSNTDNSDTTDDTSPSLGGIDDTSDSDQTQSDSNTTTSTTTEPTTTSPETTEGPDETTASPTTKQSTTPGEQTSTSTTDGGSTTPDSSTPGSTGGSTPGFGLGAAVVAAAIALGIRSR